MHGVVPDEVGHDSGRIMELRDGKGIGQGWRGDQVFSINSGGPAGGVSTGGESGCVPRSPGAQTADSKRPILRVGPLLIDPVFSSAWARLITFQTPLPFTTDEGANNNLEFLVWVSAKSQPKRRFVS